MSLLSQQIPRLPGVETRRDASELIWEEAPTFYIDPDGDTRNYYEFKWNAINTIFDIYYGQYGDDWRSGASYTAEGMKSAVKVHGTVNDDSDVDNGLVVEIAIPWTALNHNNTNIRSLPPKDGDMMRANFATQTWDARVYYWWAPDTPLEYISWAAGGDWDWSFMPLAGYFQISTCLANPVPVVTRVIQFS
jgi:hypothetical protein